MYCHCFNPGTLNGNNCSVGSRIYCYVYYCWNEDFDVLRQWKKMSLKLIILELNMWCLRMSTPISSHAANSGNVYPSWNAISSTVLLFMINMEQVQVPCTPILLSLSWHSDKLWFKLCVCITVRKYVHFVIWFIPYC